MAIPITSYGYAAPGHQGKIIAAGEDYTFYVDPELDSFWVKEGEFLPLSGAALICLINPAAPARITYNSFSVLEDGKVQVNYTEDGCAYQVSKFSAADCYIEGESYSEDD